MFTQYFYNLTMIKIYISDTMLIIQGDYPLIRLKMTKNNQKKVTGKNAIDKDLIDALVKKAQSGDADAFGEVYNQLLTPIYRYIYFKVGPQIVEDLTEEVFFKAWQNIKKYKKKQELPFSAWLFRIAHNQVVDYYRSHQVIEEIPEEFGETRKSMQTTTLVEEHFNNKVLYKGLKQLSQTVEQAIILRFINDLNYPEIAKIMNKTEGAIRVLVHRGLSQLKQILAK